VILSSSWIGNHDEEPRFFNSDHFVEN